MDTIRLLIRSYGMHVKSVFEYRPAFVTDGFTVIVAYAVMYIGLWIIMERFKLIQGWTLYEVMFLFNMNLLAYSLTAFAFRTPMLEDIEDMVRMGRFDIVLTKPVNSLIYVMMGRCTEGYFGQISVVTVVFIMCFTNLEIEWTALKIIFMITTVIGATLIQTSIFLSLGALTFFVVRHNAIYNLVNGTGRGFIDYPISIYDKFIQVVFTFIIPFAFINFYPAHYLLNKTGDVLFHPVLQYLTPAVGIISFFLAYKFWTIGVNHYESTGS